MSNIYQITNGAGDVVNTIVATPGFVEANNPGLFVYVGPSPPVPAQSTSDQVDAERDRRIDGGFTFGGVRYQSRVGDRENIAGAATAALGAMVANGPSVGNLRWHGGPTDFVWIAEDNSENLMDPHQVFAFGQAAMAHKSAMIFAGRAIKDRISAGEAVDITDAVNWPA